MAATDRFDVFISYARAASAELADDLHTGLEKFAKPWHRLRAIRVFHDESSMAANTALWKTIERGLSEARWFVLIATPEAAHSEYVNAEVAWWLHNKGPDTLLLVHGGGTIAWDRAGNDFTADSTAVPPILRRAFPQEPRWIGMEWFNQPASLRSADPRFIERVADLSAAVRGVPRDTLIGENVAELRKARRLARGGVVGLVLLLVAALAAGAVALVQRSSAIRAATVAQSRQLAATADSLSQTDLQSALLLAATGYRTTPELATERSLLHTLTASPHLEAFVAFADRVTAAAGTGDGRFLAVGTANGEIHRVDRRTGAREVLASLGGPPAFVGISADGKTVAAAKNPYGNKASPGTASMMWREGSAAATLPGVWVRALSPSGDIAVATTTNANAFQVITRTGTRTIAHPTANENSNLWMVMPDDRSFAVMTMEGRYARFDVDGRLTAQTVAPIYGWMLASGALSGNGLRFAYPTDAADGAMAVWDLAGPLPPRMTGKPLTVDSGGTAPRDLALDRDGKRLATAASGKITVATAGQATSGDITLPGAGDNPTTVSFVSPDRLVSAAGKSVALWNLGAAGGGSQTFPLAFGETCNACGPPAVKTSPNGSRVAVRSMVLDTHDGGTVDLGSAEAALWLDDQRLLVTFPHEQRAQVRSGPRLERVEQDFTIPELDPRSSLVRRDDGLVVGISDPGKAPTGSLILINPGDGTVKTNGVKAGGLSPTGDFAVNLLGKPNDATTPVQIIDTRTGGVVNTVAVDGRPLAFTAPVPGGFALLRSEATGAMGTDLLRIGVRGDRVDHVANLRARIPIPAMAVVSGTKMYVESDGTIVRYDLRDGSSLALMPVRSAHHAWNAVGISADGSRMYVASEPQQTLTSMPVSAGAWLDTACRLAGRKAEPDDFAGLLPNTDHIRIGCR